MEVSDMHHIKSVFPVALLVAAVLLVTLIALLIYLIARLPQG